ncbi:AI-2E family transporter [Cellulosilyticum sp. I15G10I2]|uniref:AI-2E family transporter n=1 Tax=Cellulosilyticum sp. I15G10I2 TaxID=1892843 RepID=UPI002E8DE23D|nr:AI-2E family transporter [Cellulosilyticum sp. I15G10I2]
MDFILKILSILSPFIVGVSIAFVLNIPMKLFETKVFYSLDRSKTPALRKLKRPLSIAATLILVFGFLIGLTLFIIPQLIESTATLVNAVPGYVQSLETLVNQYINSSELLNALGNEILMAWKDFIQVGSKFLGTSLAGLLTMTLGFTTSVVNFGLSLVLAVYMLASKEKLILQTKKVIFAFFNKSTAAQILHLGEITDLAFYRFIAGQFTEALIIGALCFIGMSLLALPYPLLISVIIAVTSLIPIFGAFIGTVPAAFIIFIIDPLKALWFIVFIVILQQFEGNIIYPRVVGNSIGLSGLWVLLAMVIGGSTFGLLGMLLGIPIFSILYQILRTIVYKRLHTKKIVKIQ